MKSLKRPGTGPPCAVQDSDERITLGNSFRDDADCEQVIDLLDGDRMRGEFLLDGVEPLDARLHPPGDMQVAQLCFERFDDALEECLSLAPQRLDFSGERGVRVRIGIAEREVFELAAQFAHAQPMSQRRVDVERFARDLLLLFRLKVLERAHVVQAVGELDEHHAHVGDHGQQHLANVFGLVLFAVGELDFVELGDTFDDVRDLLTESFGDFR